MSRPDAQELALEPHERELLPTDAEVEFYAEHGWYLSRKLFTDDEIEQVDLAARDFYAGRRDRTLPTRPPTLAYWEPRDGDVMRHNDYVHYESDAISSIVRKPLLGAVAARLARAREIRIFQCTLIYKPPRADEPSNIVPWHFDRHYWASSTSERMLTAFLPFHDCDESMGTITMVDGSHRWKEVGWNEQTTLHFAARDRTQLDRMLEDNARFNSAELRRVPVHIPRGHVSFHHCRTYHGSGPNRSGRSRRAISIHLQDADNRYREFRRSNGERVAYNHDRLVRKLPSGEPDYADPEFCPAVWKE